MKSEAYPTDKLNNPIYDVWFRVTQPYLHNPICDVWFRVAQPYLHNPIFYYEHSR